MFNFFERSFLKSDFKSIYAATFLQTKLRPLHFWEVIHPNNIWKRVSLHKKLELIRDITSDNDKNIFGHSMNGALKTPCQKYYLKNCRIYTMITTNEKDRCQLQNESWTSQNYLSFLFVKVSQKLNAKINYTNLKAKVRLYVFIRRVYKFGYYLCFCIEKNYICTKRTHVQNGGGWTERTMMVVGSKWHWMPWDVIRLNL